VLLCVMYWAWYLLGPCLFMGRGYEFVLIDVLYVV